MYLKHCDGGLKTPYWGKTYLSIQQFVFLDQCNAACIDVSDQFILPVSCIVLYFPSSGAQYPVTCNATRPGVPGQYILPNIDEICGRPTDAQLRTNQLEILTRIGALSEKVCEITICNFLLPNQYIPYHLCIYFTEK